MSVPTRTPRKLRMRFTLAGALGTAALLLSCSQDDPTEPDPAASLPTAADPSYLIVDGAHNGLVGFYWYLPTLKPSPPKTLTPDPDLTGLNPVVAIIRCSNDNCTSFEDTVAKFSPTSTPAIRYINGSKQYQVSWNTSARTAGTYRMAVFAGANGFRRNLLPWDWRT